MPYIPSAGVPSDESGTSSVGLFVQFIEIYNDKIRDLLHPGADSSAFRVREHPQTGPYVDNLVPVQVRVCVRMRRERKRKETDVTSLVAGDVVSAVGIPVSHLEFRWNHR